MKNFLKIVLIFCCIFLLGNTHISGAQNEVFVEDDTYHLILDNSIIFCSGYSKVSVNYNLKYIDKADINVKVNFDNKLNYLPVKFLIENFGGYLDVNKENNTAEINYNGKKIEIHEGDTKIIVDSKEISLKAPVILKDGNLFMPAETLINTILNKKLFYKDNILIIYNSEYVKFSYITNERLRSIVNYFNNSIDYFLIDKQTERGEFVRGKYAYIDINGKTVISSEYPYAEEFTDGLALVTKNFDDTFINKTGDFVFNKTWFNANSFADGMAFVRLNFNEYGYINKSGRMVAHTYVSYGYDYSEGLANVTFKKDGKYGYINKKGQVVLALKYDYAAPFKCGMARVEVNGKDGLINKKGEFLIKPNFYNIRYNEYGSSFVAQILENKQPKYVFIDKAGKILSKDSYDDAYPISDGLARVMRKVNGKPKYGFVDRNFNQVVDFIYDKAEDFTEGLALVKVGSKYNFIDQTGKLLTKDGFAYAQSFSEGLAEVSVDHEFSGFIDHTGNYMIAPKFKIAYQFKHGLAYVGDGKLEGYINRKGEYVWSRKYKPRGFNY